MGAVFSKAVVRIGLRRRRREGGGGRGHETNLILSSSQFSQSALSLD